MRLAIMLRGHHFVQSDRFGNPMDARHNIPSLLDRLINPIRRISPGAKVYLVTYDSPVLEDIKAQIGPCEVVLINPIGSSQAETYKEGLEYIHGKGDFDALVVSRFDLKFKKSFDTWAVKPDSQSIFFPWREFLSYWRDHRRVGDAVHVIGNEVLPAFHAALTMCLLAQRSHLHLMYYFLRTMRSELRFIEDGYWSSNTLFANPECDNPLYDIFNRQRLQQMAGTTGMILDEIRAE